MITRGAEETIHTMLRSFPIVTITGPRQSRKTTLAKAIFSDKPYASLEAPDIRLLPKMIHDRFWIVFPTVRSLTKFNAVRSSSPTYSPALMSMDAWAGIS